MTTIEFYGKLTKEEIDKIESARMEFCRRMKMPDKGTVSIEGRGLGDLPYAPWEKFKP